MIKSMLTLKPLLHLLLDPSLSLDGLYWFSFYRLHLPILWYTLSQCSCYLHFFVLKRLHYCFSLQMVCYLFLYWFCVDSLLRYHSMPFHTIFKMTKKRGVNTWVFEGGVDDKQNVYLGNCNQMTHIFFRTSI